MKRKNTTAKTRRAKSNPNPNTRPGPKSLINRFRELDVPWENVDDANWMENFAYLFFSSLQLDSQELGWLGGIASEFATKNEAAKAAAELTSKVK